MSGRRAVDARNDDEPNDRTLSSAPRARRPDRRFADGYRSRTLDSVRWATTEGILPRLTVATSLTIGAVDALHVTDGGALAASRVRAWSRRFRGAVVSQTQSCCQQSLVGR